MNAREDRWRRWDLRRTSRWRGELLRMYLQIIHMYKLYTNDVVVLLLSVKLKFHQIMQ